MRSRAILCTLSFFTSYFRCHSFRARVVREESKSREEAKNRGCRLLEDCFYPDGKSRARGRTMRHPGLEPKLGQNRGLPKEIFLHLHDVISVNNMNSV